MPFRFVYGLLSIIFLISCNMESPALNMEQLKQQVSETEMAFAKTMTDRDFEAFKTYLSDEAIFFSGPEPLHGKQAVADWWLRYYEKPMAPFSWKPETIEVLRSGTLALSSGPVHDPDGKLIGTFTSIWRLEEGGVWRIVFDKGNEVCD